jgi:hypothetical protein
MKLLNIPITEPIIILRILYNVYFIRRYNMGSSFHYPNYSKWYRTPIEKPKIILGLLA